MYKLIFLYFKIFLLCIFLVSLAYLQNSTLQELDWVIFQFDDTVTFWENFSTCTEEYYASVRKLHLKVTVMF